MKIEILNTGTELLLGSKQNTHGTWIAQELFKVGLRVQRQTTVPDGEGIEVALAECVKRSDVVVVTGGLGPTSDDLTRESTARVLGLELMEDEAALRSLQAFFEKRGRKMADSNRKQIQSLVGSDILRNENGTAPGIYIPPRLSGSAACAVFLLPGPPSELCPMFLEEVVPRLRALSGIELVDELCELKFVGVGESDMQDAIDARLAAVPGLEYGYCARIGEVDLHLIGQPEAIRAAREIAQSAFPQDLVNDTGESLESTVVAMMKKKGWILAVAESCTGGLVASRITDISGSSAVLSHGFVTYANEAKNGILGVRRADLEKFGAVSEPVARQMADGALRVSGADLAVATTGLAGPGTGGEDKPVGTIFFALAQKGRETQVWQEIHPRGRLDFKQAASQRALDLVRRACL